MRHAWVIATASLVAVALTGCVAVSPAQEEKAELTAMLVQPAEAESLGGWAITPDDGPVDGESTDCTGAPYDWPDINTLAHASEFLDREMESIALLIKRQDADTAANVEALRGALAPCSPSTGGARKYGAVIEPVGDDSFAYQSLGSDDMGDYTFSNMLIACGDLILEVFATTYSGDLDQAELEELVSPSVERMQDAADC